MCSGGLGCYKGRKFTIEVDQPVHPKYFKARTVSYALHAKIDEDLGRLKKEGIICPITHSPWDTAVVPVLKPNGKIRFCGDYKLTVNWVAKLDTYPIPTLDDLLSSFAGGKIFYKLDMSQAFGQLCLDNESKQYTVINTHSSLFQYNKLILLCRCTSKPSPNVLYICLEENNILFSMCKDFLNLLFLV